MASDATLPPGQVIEVFADVVCPFTHVGLRRLVDERGARGRQDVSLRVRCWPLELVNGQPLDAEKVAEEVRALQASVAPDLFAGFDAGCWPTSSLAALALTAAAFDVSPAVGEAMALDLRWALFEEGLDISDADVLASMARRHGVVVDGPERARARVIEDWHEGQDRGVVGSPHFFVGDRDLFCPTLAISHVDGRFDIEVDTVAFADFMRRCFG